MNKPRVLVFAHSPGLSGAERSLLETLTLLQDRFSFLVIVPGDGPFLTALQAETQIPFQKIRSYFFYEQRRAKKIHRWRRRLANIWALRRARQIARTWAPDLIYTNTIASWLGPQIAQRMACPHVWHLRELSVESSVGLPVSGHPAERDLFTRPGHHFLSNSQFVANWYAQQFGAQVKVAYQPVSVAQNPAPTAKDAQPLRFVSLGRLAAEKGHHIAIQALALLPPSLQAQIRFSIFGHGSAAYQAELRALIAKNNLQQLVTLEGVTKSGHHKIAEATGVIVAASDEPFGRVTAEAMLLGCPVIGAASGGTLEQIGADEARGSLFETGIAEDLAKAITRFAEDPAQAQAKAITAQIWAQTTLSPQRYTDQLVQTFQAALTRKA